MIIKSWEFRGFEWSHDLPDWLQSECSKRRGSPYLWVHTQRGEQPAKSGQYISVNLRGHLDVHNEKPDGWKKETIAGVAFTVVIAAVLVIVLAM